MTDSHDSPDNDDRQLTSSVFDNEATPDERATVAASPSLTAEVGAHRALRDVLTDVTVPAQARESAIASALAVFDTLQGGGPTTTTSEVAAPVATVVSLDGRRRGRQTRWLAGIAAAAVVGLIGVAAITGGRGSENKSASFSDGSVSTDSLAKASASPAPEADTQVPTALNSAASDSESAVGAAATTVGSTDPWAGAPEFTNDQQLIAYANEPGSPLSPTGASTQSVGSTADAPATSTATHTADSTASTTAASTGNSTTAPCPPPTGGPTTPAIYIGRRVLVSRNVDADQLIVIDAATCQVVTTIAVP